MIKFFHKVQRVYLGVDLIFILVSFYVPYVVRYNSLQSAYNKQFLPIISEDCFIFTLWAVLIVTFFTRNRLYATDRDLSIPRELLRVIICISCAAILTGSVMFFAKYKSFSGLVFLRHYVLLFVFLGGWRMIKRLILRRLISKGVHNINVLVVGTGQVARAVLREVERHPYWGFRVTGFLDDCEELFVENIPVLGKFSDFSAIAGSYSVDEVIVAVLSEKQAVSEVIEEAKKMDIGVRIVPSSFEEPLPALSLSYLGIIPALTRRAPDPLGTIFKKLFDFMVSLILAILFSPLFVIVGLLIKLCSDGPIFYVQQRVGFKGRVFDLYKFRSMIKDADRLKPKLLENNELKGDILFKIKKDPRITRLGKFLRKYSLDELPQLFNVLKGDMSLVGPRPPTIHEVEQYNHFHLERLSTKPGMTGLSQIRGRSDLPFHRWFRWDLWYIRNWSFGLDVQILLWTIPAVLKGKGAY